MSAANAWTISAVREALEAKKISARELTAEFYSRIEKKNPELNAFLALSPERAYAQADKIDAAIAAGDALPALAGVPVAIKDVISTHGIPTTCGSLILKGYRPPYDATAVERLESDFEPAALFAQPVFRGHAAILQGNFRGMRKPHAHLVFLAGNSKSGKRGLDQKRGNTFRSGVGVGFRKGDANSGVAADGDPAFGAVQKVFIALALGARLQSRGIGARLRLRKAERAQYFSAREPGKIFLFLRFGAVAKQRNGSHGICDAERDGGRSAHSSHFLDHQDVADRIRSGAAPFFRHQHSAAAHLAQLANLLQRKFIRALVFAQNRAHLRFHELAHGIADQLLIAGKRKIHK